MQLSNVDGIQRLHVAYRKGRRCAGALPGHEARTRDAHRGLRIGLAGNAASRHQKICDPGRLHATVGELVIPAPFGKFPFDTGWRVLLYGPAAYTHRVREASRLDDVIR